MPIPSPTPHRGRALFAFASLLASTPSLAADGGSAAHVPAIEEFRLGILAGDLDPGGRSDGRITINAEVLSPQLGGSDPASGFSRLLHPRFHLGASVSTDDDGVNQAYAGLTWTYGFGERLFFETSFGGAAHDGETADNNPNSYGCPVQFRESLSVGVNLTEALSMMATIDHMSNAGLCDENQGLTNAGVRFGYRW